ncbi:MAG TPA: hypothetical protein QGI07_07375 [Dehalococcoidia bacterium]|nr:hypothetical protein [Dehalococcoidia bacterium]MDP7514027.1 hypothetical protein [Dehalococcoidia bacterium]HJM53822.1 hypothetical protein [Dehalococcoidia bacterium]
MQEQVQPEQQGVTRRSFVGLAAAGIAGVIGAAAAGNKNPIGRLFGKKRTIRSNSGSAGSMFTPRDPQP